MSAILTDAGGGSGDASLAHCGRGGGDGLVAHVCLAAAVLRVGDQAAPGGQILVVGAPAKYVMV